MAAIPQSPRGDIRQGAIEVVLTAHVREVNYLMVCPILSMEGQYLKQCRYVDPLACQEEDFIFYFPLPWTITFLMSGK